jgi:hypothetical protein
LAWFGRLRIEIRHAAHPAKIANEPSFRRMVVDLDRPQIPHTLSVASFRKMIVGLDRLQIPYTLSVASFRKMVVDLDRPQIRHSLPLGSFRKMVVDLDRLHIPHSLPLGSFRKMVVDLVRPQIPHGLPLALFGQISSRHRQPAYPAHVETGFVRRVFASPRIPASYSLPTAYCLLPTVTNLMEIIVAMIVPTSLVDRAFVPLGEIVDGFVHRNRARRPSPR